MKTNVLLIIAYLSTSLLNAQLIMPQSGNDEIDINQQSQTDLQVIRFETMRVSAIYASIVQRPHLCPREECVSQQKKTANMGNASLGITYMSNYYKNVPLNERTLDDNVYYRSYIQTTSGAIYYYDEIVRMGRRN